MDHKKVLQSLLDVITNNTRQCVSVRCSEAAGAGQGCLSESALTVVDGHGRSDNLPVSPGETQRVTPGRADLSGQPSAQHRSPTLERTFACQSRKTTAAGAAFS